MSKKRIIISVAVAFALLIVAGGIIFGVNRTTNSPERLISLGEKYLLEQNYEQALVQFLKVIEIDPMNPRGYTGAAEAYVELGDVAKAENALQRGLAVLPYNSDILSMLAEVEVLLATPSSEPYPPPTNESISTIEPEIAIESEDGLEGTPTAEQTEHIAPETSTEPMPTPITETAADPSDTQGITSIPLENAKAELIDIAQSALNLGSQDAVIDNISSLLDLFESDDMLNLFVGFSDEKFVSSDGWIPPTEYKPTERSWYQRAMQENGGIYVSEPYVDLNNGKSFITLAVFVGSFNGVDAVIGVDINQN